GLPPAHPALPPSYLTSASPRPTRKPRSNRQDAAHTPASDAPPPGQNLPPPVQARPVAAASSEPPEPVAALFPETAACHGIGRHRSPAWHCAVNSAPRSCPSDPPDF